jgi:hypothetical protein
VRLRGLVGSWQTHCDPARLTVLRRCYITSNLGIHERLSRKNDNFYSIAETPNKYYICVLPRLLFATILSIPHILVTQTKETTKLEMTDQKMESAQRSTVLLYVCRFSGPIATLSVSGKQRRSSN